MTETPASPSQPEQVSAVVREVLARWLEPGYHPHVSSPWCITQGPCVEFADEVVELLTERHPEIGARVGSSDDAARDIGREFNAYHAFVEAAGLCFDSQETGGVRDPFMLPFLARELRIAMIEDERALPGEDGEDDEDPGDEVGPGFGP